MTKKKVDGTSESEELQEMEQKLNEAFGVPVADAAEEVPVATDEEDDEEAEAVPVETNWVHLMMSVITDWVERSHRWKDDGLIQIMLDPDFFPPVEWEQHQDVIKSKIAGKGWFFAQKKRSTTSFWIFKDISRIKQIELWDVWGVPVESAMDIPHHEPTLPPMNPLIDEEVPVATDSFIDDDANDAMHYELWPMEMTTTPVVSGEADEVVTGIPRSEPPRPGLRVEYFQQTGRGKIKTLEAANAKLEKRLAELEPAKERLRKRQAVLETENADLRQSGSVERSSVLGSGRAPAVEFDYVDDIQAEDLATRVNEGWEIHTLQILSSTVEMGGNVFPTDPRVFVVFMRQRR